MQSNLLQAAGFGSPHGADTGRIFSLSLLPLPFCPSGCQFAFSVKTNLRPSMIFNLALLEEMPKPGSVVEDTLPLQMRGGMKDLFAG